MIRSILVPVDASPHAETAVRYAARIAKKAGAELVGLHVVDGKILNGPLLRDISFMADAFHGFEYADEVRRALEEKGRRTLDRFAELCRELAVQGRTALETGIVPEVIAEAAKRADLVVMGKRGENRDHEQPFLGSVVEAAVRLCSRAVIVVPEEDRKIERILVAYDGSKNANRAIKMLQDLAGLGNFEILVLTVAAPDDPVAAAMGEGVAFLRERGLAAEGILRSGDPVETIARACDELSADILVMGAYGQSRFRQFLLGSTTTQVVRRVAVPVLLYR